MRKVFIFSLRMRLVVLAVCLTFVASSGIAFAQDSGFTEQDLKDINNQTPWYGPSIDGCTIDGPPGSFTGDNIRDAFLYFMDPGRDLTAIQSAGIVGNLIQESGVNPRSNQPNGPGMGIAQWSEGERWEELKKWAAENNKGDPYTLGAQLDFLWYEMSGASRWGETLPLMRQVVIGGSFTDDEVVPPLRDYLHKPGGAAFPVTDANEAVTAATFVFERKFERADPLFANMPRRVQNAKSVLERFGSLAPADAGSTDVNAVPRTDDQGLCGGTGIGQGNVNTQGYSWPVADQKKHDYGTAPCKSYTCHHDGTAAFDLMYGARGNMDGKPVYAITSGKIVKQGIYRGVPGCYSIQFQSDLTYGTSGKPYFYWYGHLQNPKYATNDTVGAGKQLAEVARLMIAGSEEASERCRGGRDHLHIDRGCIVGNEPQWGGSESCRDPAFVPLMNKLWEELPA